MSRKWIFLRGLGRHSAHWGPFLQEFKKHFPKDQIELLDLRGNGSLAHSPSYLSIQENVRDLRSRSQWIQEGEKVHLMTISLGSMVATEWARLFPDEISGFVAMNTSDRGTSSFFERMKPANYLLLLQMLAVPRKGSWIENQILRLTTNILSQLDPVAQEFSEWKSTTRLNFLRQLVAAGTYEFPRQKPKTEILLLCSDGDKLVNSGCTKKIAEMWTMKAHIHPTAGHDISLDAPDWICEEIKNWLDLCLHENSTNSKSQQI